MTVIVTESKILDGTATAKAIRGELREQISSLKETTGLVPGVGVVLVGSRPDSASYVRMTTKVANEIGVHVVDSKLDETAAEDEGGAAVERLNADPSVHGILVQLPLPPHVDARAHGFAERLDAAATRDKVTAHVGDALDRPIDTVCLQPPIVHSTTAAPTPTSERVSIAAEMDRRP